MSTQTGLSTLQFMARYNTAIHSLESPDGKECIDVFRRPDATFGFEKYRRDVEDCRGWFPTGYFSGVVFNTAVEALLEAQKHVLWLNHVRGPRPLPSYYDPNPSQIGHSRLFLLAGAEEHE